MNWAAAPVWGSILLFALIAETAKGLLIRRLRTSHPFAWTQLGLPTYFSKNSFDLLGQLAPLLKDARGDLAADATIRTLFLVRRASYWVFAVSALVVALIGRGDMLTVYKSEEPFSIVVYGVVIVGLMAIAAAWHAWRTRRDRRQ